MKRTLLVVLRGAIGVALAVALLPAIYASAQRAEQGPQAGQPAAPAPPTARMTPDGKKVLTLADYGPWKRITSTALSGDGKWMTYTLSPNDGDETLIIKQLDGGLVYTIPIGPPAAAGRGGGRGGAGGGASVQFSDDGRWIAYDVNPPSPPPGRGRATAPGSGGGAGQTGGPGGGRSGGRTGAPASGGGGSGAPLRHLELFDLMSGSKVDVPNAGAFQFSKGSQWLAIKMNAAAASDGPGPATAIGRGTDLLLRRLATGSTENIGNVSLYDFDESGSWLAYAVDAENHLGNGVYAVNLATGDTRALDNAALTYDGLAWAAGSKRLVALRGETPKGKTQRENALVFWSDASQSSAIVWDPSTETSFPKGFVLSEASAPRWARDGSRVFIGIKPQSDLVVESTEPKANLDIWHWKDVELQSEQILRVAQARRATYAAVFDVVSQSFVRLTDNALETITPTANGRLAIARDPSSYDQDFSEGQPNRADYYKVDTTTGTRTLVAKHLLRTMGSSTDSRWFLYLAGPQLTAFNLETGKATAIGGPESARFINTDDDHAAEKPVWGVAGWTKDGKAVLLNDKHDVWSVPLDGGKPVAITGGVGAAQSVELRLTRVLTGGAAAGGGRGGRGGGAGTATEEAVDLTQPQTFAATGEWTKKSGFWRTPAGSTQPAPIIWLDKSIGGVEKAKDADRVIFTEQTFQEFPDYWVSDSNFTSPRKVTDANPQISDYAWGSRTLVDFTNSKGKKLQATLTLPAGYQPGKKYPMLVYIYETLSNTHHDFSMPVYDDRPHMSEYASSGYLVLEPDIVYEIGKPGSSALDCVTAAVKKVIDLGYADPAHIGLQGHSWGGYESSFILTQTNIFAAVVTGAPLTDLISMYGEIYKQTGSWNGGILETSQGRMGADVTPWNARDLYESQSPLFSVTKIQTPFLILQGTADGAVDWDQGLEFYQAARKNGKQVIFLSYPDEPHHLAKTPNQKDFQVRMKQFFDHYLLGAPEPDWMKNGVSQTAK